MSLAAKEVAQYLRDHPDFFNQYADLLAQISIPDPHGGRAISITERQMGALREKVRSLEARLDELIGYGQENDALSNKTHRLAVALVAANDLASASLVLYAHLGGSFAIPHIALRVWLPGIDPACLEAQPVAATLRDFVTRLARPYCGAAAAVPELSECFDEEGRALRSVALIPLRNDEGVFGFIALGSEDAERFHDGMGTLYLERVGELAAAALTRLGG